jgi:hypothetical protein
MPVSRFRTLEEGERAIPLSPDATTGVRTALFLARLDLAVERGVRVTATGIQRFRTLAEAKAERDRYALARLREAGL